MVINNGVNAYVLNLATDTQAADKAAAEMLTNYISVIRLNEKLLPLLQQQKEAAIVVNAFFAFVPRYKISLFHSVRIALCGPSPSGLALLVTTSW